MKIRLLGWGGRLAGVLWLVVLLAAANNAYAVEKTVKPQFVEHEDIEQRQGTVGAHEVKLSLKSLGVLQPLRVLGADGRADIDFSFHTLDVIQRLRLNVSYMYSPLLDQKTTSATIILNGHEVGSLPLTKEMSAGATAVIDIDPLILEEWNHLSFRFISHMEAPYCDDPRNKNLWIQFDQRYTTIEAEAVTLPLINDLSMLPMPFFDKHDIRDMNVNFVLPKRQSWAVLKSASIISSWFGSKAEWRKVHFPVSDQLPEKDAIVLATAGDHIAGLQLPEVTEGVATIALIDNPRNPDTRLLLIVGRDEKGLVQAAQALSLKQLALVGSSQSVLGASLPKRRPLDAPKWLTVEKKIRVGDLVKPEQLTDTALFVAPFNMVMYLPPNLYRSETQWIPFDITFSSSNNTRYLHRVDAMLNGKIFQSEFYDDPEPTAPSLLKRQVQFNMPTWNLTGQDTFGLRFTFRDKVTELCTTAVVRDEIRIDPNSTLDLTGQQRYAELADLSYLAYTGFPYSQMADLSETVMLLPDRPELHEIESLLLMSGHIGNKTGYPVVGMSVDSIANVDNYADKDVLIIGATGRLAPILGKWKGEMPVDLLSDSQSFPYLGRRYMERWTDWAALSTKLKREKGNPGMVLAGFESPLKSGRSVVILAAEEPIYLVEEASVLNTFKFAKDFAGGVALIAKENKWDRVSAYERSPRYGLGELSLLEQAKRMVFHNPWLSVLFVMVITIFFASMVYRKMTRKTQERLSIGTQK